MMEKKTEKIMIVMLAITGIVIGSLLVTAAANSAGIGFVSSVQTVDKGEVPDSEEAAESERLAPLAQITSEQALQIALGAVNTGEVGPVTDVELENERGNVVYAVEFTNDGIETDVKIDAGNGNILIIESDLDEVDDETEEDDESDEEEYVSPGELDAIGSIISEQRAIEIATAQVDLAEVGLMTDVEIENEGGQIVYAVEFTKDGIETDVKMDVKTGEVLSVESDLDEEDED